MIQGLFTSKTEQGAKVAQSRIKWFLDENTSIYPDGEISKFDGSTEDLTVGSIVGDLYFMRNSLSYGEWLDGKDFKLTRRGVGGMMFLL